MKLETSELIDEWVENHGKECSFTKIYGGQFAYELKLAKIIGCQKVKCLYCKEEFVDYMD